MAFFSMDDPSLPDKILEIFDRQVRQVICLTWKTLPDEKRSVEEVDKRIGPIVDRVIQDFREDPDAFIKSNDGGF